MLLQEYHRLKKSMSRHFPSIKQFMLCNKASVTVRIIDVEPQIESFLKKNSKTGMVESVPFYRGVIQDATGAIRCTWWSMTEMHRPYQGMIGKCVLAQNFGITLAHPKFCDLSRFCCSFDGTRGSEMIVVEDDGTIPKTFFLPAPIAVGPGCQQLAASLPSYTAEAVDVSKIVSPVIPFSSQSFNATSTPLKRPGKQACCDRLDMPFCQRRAGVRHVFRCELCMAPMDDPNNPICGMTGVRHKLPAVRLIELIRGTDMKETKDGNKV